MSELVAFLAARLDEDEQRALAMKHFTVHEQPYYSCAASRTGPLGDLEWGEEFCDCFVAERKARALREVEAKRKILDIHDMRHDPCDAHDASLRSIPCDTLLALASVWSGHPDFDPSWQS